jgi:5'-nucleotidase (lipoprotein e(P4) family)
MCWKLDGSQRILYEVFNKESVMKKRLFILLLCCGAFGFAETLRTDEQLNGVLWVQTSAEYQMSTVQAFRTAALRVKEALQDNTITASLEQTADYQSLPTAVIVDVDETVLDNSPFQAQLIETGKEYSPALWSEWVKKAQAEAIPGAKEFVDFLKGQGVELFYVTNRKLKEPTLENIRAVLDPEAAADHVLCKYEKRGWGSDKTPRRAQIAKTHRILLLVGDDTNDFAALGKTDAAERTHLAQQFQENWGTRWIVVSNPLYGNWERTLYEYNYSFSRQEKIDRKLQQLRAQPDVN